MAPASQNGRTTATIPGGLPAGETTLTATGVAISGLFGSLRDGGELKGKCGACEYRQVCGGSRSRAYATTGDPLASDPLCGYVPEGYDGPLPWDEAGEEPASAD